jgi:hypothetical protein
MKKVLLSFLISVLIISALSFGVSAEEYADTRDSRYIPSDALSQIGNSGTIVKFYNYSLLIDFAECQNIEEVLSRRNQPKYIGYYKQTGNRLLRYSYSVRENYEKLWDPKVVNQNNQHISEMLQELQTMEAISTVSPDIAIGSIYYMDATAQDEGTAIYYKTNLGDYVFYRHLWDGTQMLCTAERFFEYKRAEIEAWYGKYGNQLVSGGSAGIENWDLSVYDYRSPNFNPAAPLPNGKDAFPWLGLGAVVLSLAAVLAVWIIRRRKSVQEAEI